MRRATIVVLALVSACASLPDDGALMCGSDPSAPCPAGFYCAGDGRCYRNGHDGGSGGLVVTAHDVDTNPALVGATVTVTATVSAVAVTTSHSATTGRCQYQAFLQDPNGPNPSGLDLFDAIANCAPDDGGATCTCPQPPSSGTPFDLVTTLGDVITVTGVVSTFGNNPPAHELHPLLSVTKTGRNAPIFPLAFADGNAFTAAGGVPTYEAMLVRIAPPAPFTIGNVDMVGDFLGAGAQFTGIFRSIYGGGPPYFPAGGSTWSAITGVASLGVVQGISPRAMTDFKP